MYVCNSAGRRRILNCHRPRKRTIQYSRDISGRNNTPRRTGCPACAGHDGGTYYVITSSIPRPESATDNAASEMRCLHPSLRAQRSNPALRTGRCEASSGRRRATASIVWGWCERVPPHMRIEWRGGLSDLDVALASPQSLQGRPPGAPCPSHSTQDNTLHSVLTGIHADLPPKTPAFNVGRILAPHPARINNKRRQTALVFGGTLARSAL